MASYKRPDKHFQDCVAALSEKPTKRRITDAQIVEIIWANSQCVHNQRERDTCPLLLFGRQIADEINRFFYDDED